MKWSSEQLLKLAHQGLTFSETVDYTSLLTGNDDILAISPAKIDGEYTFEDPDFIFDLTIQVTLTMACSKTLKPVEVPLYIEVEEVFSHFVGEDSRLIEQNTVDLYPIVWSNIYLEKPLKVVHPEAEDLNFDEPSKPKGHPGLQDLEKYK